MRTMPPTAVSPVSEGGTQTSAVAPHDESFYNRRKKEGIIAAARANPDTLLKPKA